MLFSEPKIPQICRKTTPAPSFSVSVLFSEPKIPQNVTPSATTPESPCFSALQRAENSSNSRPDLWEYEFIPFQCSSASRKFLKFEEVSNAGECLAVSVLFSEPKIPQTARSHSRSSTPTVSVLFSEPKIPQTNSIPRLGAVVKSFSALQRAENSSNFVVALVRRWQRGFSALQRAENSSKKRRNQRTAQQLIVSVLFSEPKIPQRIAAKSIDTLLSSFSALQRAENSSNVHRFVQSRRLCEFQCSSASRKFLKDVCCVSCENQRPVSVLFSEPKIPQNVAALMLCGAKIRFQCSSASRKFLKWS